MDTVKLTVRAATKDVIAELALPPFYEVERQFCKLVTRIPAGDEWAHKTTRRLSHLRPDRWGQRHC